MRAAPDERDEAAWITAARRGDRRAFGALVQVHQSYLRQFLRRWCRGDAALADDLAQEAFLAAWRGLAGFRGEARFRSWLTRLALSALGQHHRRPQALSLDGGLEARLDEGTEEAPRAATDARIDLARALEQLGSDEREAVLLCLYADLSHAEAAAWLGCPVGTVKSRVLRGRAKLRERMGLKAPKEDVDA